MNLQSEGSDYEPSAVTIPPEADFSFTSEVWNSTQVDYPRDVCVQQLFEAQVERSPDAVAVVFEDKWLTYRQLNQQANQLAHYLRTLGVKPEVLVGIYVERSLEMVVGLLGILKAGGAYVPLTPGTPPERLSFILEETQVSVVLTQARLFKDLPVRADAIVCLDSDWESIACSSQENPGCETTPDNLIYVIYTSGSTGQPKGVMINHAGICNQLFWRQTTFPLTPVDRILQNISFSFDPSVWQIFWTLSFGAQLVLPRPDGHQDSAYLVELIAQKQITVIAQVPSMLRVLLKEKGVEQCHSLKHVFCGGEPLPYELQEQFYARLPANAVLHNIYGPTEASIDATIWTCKPGTSHRVVPIGKPIANTQIYILDPNLQPVPVGEPGELHIGGTGLARGYFKRPELTAKKFIANPLTPSNIKSEAADATRLYKTGDLARYLPGGDIEFLGRIDYQVKIRGFRIELEEIEAVLNQHPSVQQSVVVACEDNSGDQRLVAYLVPDREQVYLISELRRFLQEKLPEYMVPSGFVLLERLPLNYNGKVDRHALPAPDLNRPTLAEPFVAPQTAVERELCCLWKEVLGIESIGIQDNFFELGGNSLLAARLLTQIEAVFHKKLSFNMFLQIPTIAQQADAISEKGNITAWKSIVPIQPKGSQAPLFCVHAVDGYVLYYYKLAHYLGNDQPLYGLQAQGLDDQHMPHESIEEMATAYIEELRSLQPSGPYFLTGYSFGGLVAYEMARQLHAQGQAIAMLVLLDTYNAPGEWFTWLSLRDRLSHKILERLFRRIRRLYRKAVDPQDKFVDRAQLVQTKCKAAIKKYYPQPYSNQMILIRTTIPPDKSDLQPISIGRDLGWQQLVQGGLEIQEVDCQHHTLLLEPHVEVLAQKLKACLSAAQQLSG
jgi:amino acid adenylation domain-containing protein